MRNVRGFEYFPNVVEVVRPHRLPSSEDDVAEWAVYADALLAAGARGAELLAHELALPVAPSHDQLAAFHAAARKVYRQRATASFGWSVGHIRELELRPERWTRSSTMSTPKAVIENATRLIEQPKGALVESVGLVVTEHIDDRALRQLFAALPDTCRRVTIELCSDFRVERVVELLPDRVRELSIIIGYGGYECDLRPSITDRFDGVTVDGRITRDQLDTLVAHLATTRRVLLRLRELTAELPERCVLIGSPGPALVNHATGHRVALPRWTLIDLERRFGPIPIRAQLARTLPEGYQLTDREARLVATPPNYQLSLVRRSGKWTLCGGDPGVYLRGQPVASGEIVEVTPGDSIALIEDDAARRYELIDSPDGLTTIS